MEHQCCRRPTSVQIVMDASDRNIQTVTDLTINSFLVKIMKINMMCDNWLIGLVGKFYVSQDLDY